MSREVHGLFLYHIGGGGARWKWYSVLSHRVILLPIGNSDIFGVAKVILYSPPKLAKRI